MKIIKNTTALDIILDGPGITVPALGQVTLESSDYDKLTQTTNILTLIGNGDIVINDGIDDLSIAEAVKFIYLPDFAENIRFKNDATNENLFEAKETQEAIEEADRGFSWHTIPQNKSLKIKQHRDMVIADDFEVEDGGELIIEGRLSVI
jgi:hypothetical protein